MSQVKYTKARIADVFGGSFECRACGLDAPATVTASGRGSAHGHGDESSEEAMQHAGADANGVAARTLTFYPCPKCGKVDPSSRSYRIQVILGSLLLGALLCAGLRFLLVARFGRTGNSTAYWGVGAVIGGILTVVLYYWWGRPWRGVKRRVSVDLTQARMTPLD